LKYTTQHNKEKIIVIVGRADARMRTGIGDRNITSLLIGYEETGSITFAVSISNRSKQLRNIKN
jgi:hypothetical protein